LSQRFVLVDFEPNGKDDKASDVSESEEMVEIKLVNNKQSNNED
tara:strand:+ start:484 stop:615 length:132 start_codon:yes stop_codon:yes gene_type:complete